jgi:hypothetical protein
MLTGVLAIRSLHSLEVILINYDAYAATASILKAAHDTASAIDLHVPPRAYDFGWQQNRKVNHGAYGHIVLHRKQYAVGRDIFRLRHVRAALCLYRRRKMQRETRRTLHFFEVPHVGLHLSHLRFARVHCHASLHKLPSADFAFMPNIQTQGQRTPANLRLKVTEVIEQMEANCFYLNGLENISKFEFKPGIHPFSTPISGQITVNSYVCGGIVGNKKAGQKGRRLSARD